MTLLKTAAKIGGIYFLLFSIFYVSRFLYAYQAFRKYHSTATGVDIAHTLLSGLIVFEKDAMNQPGYPVFTILALLAIAGFLVWVYYTIRGEKPEPIS